MTFDGWDASPVDYRDDELDVVDDGDERACPPSTISMTSTTTDRNYLGRAVSGARAI